MYPTLLLFDDCILFVELFCRRMLLDVMYIFTIVFIFLAGCSADGGKVSARDVLKENDNTDVLKYNGFMYNNVTELEWYYNQLGEQRLVRSFI